MNERDQTPARTYDEVEATKTMLDRTEQCFNLKPKRLAGAITDMVMEHDRAAAEIRRQARDTVINPCFD